MEFIIGDDFIDTLIEFNRCYYENNKIILLELSNLNIKVTLESDLSKRDCSSRKGLKAETKKS